MSNIEQKAQKVLSGMGFPEVKFTGREPYRGGERLLFKMPNGDPVLDAPVLVARGDEVEVRSPLDFLH